MARASRFCLIFATIGAIAVPASARAAESLPILIADDFTNTLVGIRYAGAPQQTWIVPADTHAAGFETWGGRGVSDEPWSHGSVWVPVTPGEALTIEFGGPGLQTSVSRGDEVLIRAAGADGGGPSFTTPTATHSWMTREGGGEAEREGKPEGAADHGWVRVHYTAEPPEPPVLGPRCRVPSLVGKKPKAARLALAAAGCSAGTIARRPSRPNRRGLVKRQSQPPGTMLPRDAAVDLVVGRGPYSGATPR